MRTTPAYLRTDLRVGTAAGTGIAKRSPEYIAAKMTGGKAVVALDGEKLVGFSYIEC